MAEKYSTDLNNLIMQLLLQSRPGSGTGDINPINPEFSNSYKYLQGIDPEKNQALKDEFGMSPPSITNGPPTYNKPWKQKLPHEQEWWMNEHAYWPKG